MSPKHGQMPVLTNPFLWGLVVVTTVVGTVALGPTSGVGVLVGGVLGVLLLAVGARLVDELRTPTYDSKIDPWDD